VRRRAHDHVHLRVVDAARVAYRHRPLLDGSGRRAPRVDDGKAFFQPRLCRVAQRVAQALLGRLRGVIAVRQRHRRAPVVRFARRAVAGAARMIVDDNFRGAGQPRDQRLDFGRVDRRELCVVAKVVHPRRLLGEGEALDVEREAVGQPSRVAHGHRLRDALAHGAGGIGCRRALVEHRRHARIDHVHHRYGDVGRCRGRLLLPAHGGSSVRSLPALGSEFRRQHAGESTRAASHPVRPGAWQRRAPCAA
jgi:hypothetical protein